MAREVNRRTLTPNTKVLSEAIPCQICGGKSATKTGFLPSTSAYPRQYHTLPQMLHNHSSFYHRPYNLSN